MGVAQKADHLEIKAQGVEEVSEKRGGQCGRIAKSAHQL